MNERAIRRAVMAMRYLRDVQPSMLDVKNREEIDADIEFIRRISDCRLDKRVSLYEFTNIFYGGIYAALVMLPDTTWHQAFRFVIVHCIALLMFKTFERWGKT